MGDRVDNVTVIEDVVHVQCEQQKQLGELVDGQKSLMDICRMGQESFAVIQESQLAMQKSGASVVDLVLRCTNESKNLNQDVQNLRNRVESGAMNNNSTMAQTVLEESIVNGVCGGCNQQRYAVSVTCILEADDLRYICSLCSRRLMSSSYRRHIKSVCFPKKCCRR